MPLNVVVGTAEKACVKIEVAKGTQKRATRIEAYDGSAWKLVQSFAPPISLAASPASSNASLSSPSIVVITSVPVTATVTGGTGPYSYLWAQTGGPAASVDSPFNATSRFAMALGPGSTEQGIFTCTVTDSNGLTAQAIATVTFRNISGA